jgi:hypothetical protein
MTTRGALIVQDTVVAFARVDQGDFISLTDIAKVKNASEPKDVVNGVEFDSFKLEAGTNSFTLSPSKWIEATGAIGIKLAASPHRACVTCY